MKFSLNIAVFILVGIICVIFSTTLYIDAAEEDLTLFAAASTTNAVKDIVKLYKEKGFGNIKTSFASSSTLAKQIANGAPADIFLSANNKWMNYLEDKGTIQKQTRFNLLGNRIALIVPLQSPVQKISIDQGLDISSFLGKDGRIAMGDPAHVPAGMYGKQALVTLGLWDKISNRIAPMKDVRAALVMVERAETPIGIVYATDAAISRKVRIAGLFPSECHQEIVYPIAVVKEGKSKACLSFMKFLKTEAVRSIFIKYGFEVK